MMKKVIIPTLRFPPAGGVGLRRMIKMGKKLAAQGVEVHFITTNNSAQVNSYIKDIEHPNIVINKICSLSLNNYLTKYKVGIISKIVSRLIYTVTLPLYFVDYATLWGLILIPYTAWYMKRNNIRNIYVSGPAFSTLFHMAVLKYYIGNDVNLVSEWRDYWTDDFERQYIPPRFISKKIQRWMEDYVLRQSDKIVSVTPTLLESLNRDGNSNKAVLIENGFDKDDFNFKFDAKNQNHEITICYTGNIVDTRAEGLFLFLDYLKRHINNQYVFEICGELGYGIKKRIEREYEELLAKKILIYHGLVSVKDAISIIERSRFGLVLVQRQHPEALTSKFFEYCCARKSILAIGPQGDLQDKMKNMGIGLYCELDNFVDSDIDGYLHGNNVKENFDLIIQENDFGKLAQKLKELFI